MTTFNFKDITLFFRSNCCQSSTQGLDETSGPESLVRTLPKKQSKIKNQLKRYVKHKGMNQPLYATTITIGRKWIGKLSAAKQYKQMVKDIKKHIPYRHDTRRYIYTFEYQMNGQLHAHGIEISSLPGAFYEDFSKYGKRNLHKDSYQQIKHLDQYIDYIDKEHAFPYITNIKKKEYVIDSLPPLEEANLPDDPSGLM